MYSIEGFNYIFQTARAARGLRKTVLVKKFPRFEDPFCLGIEEKVRNIERISDLQSNITADGETARTPGQPVQDPSTPTVRNKIL